MRAKDLDSVLPRVSFELSGDDLVIDGARTKLVNGAITQNGLELIERLRQDKKDLEAILKEAEDRILRALKDGSSVQTGNRRAVIKVTERTNPKYKEAVLHLAKLDPKDKEGLDAVMGPFCSTSKSESLKID